MKYLYCITLLVIMVAAAGCSKSGGKSNRENYTITGISDITVPQYTDTIVKTVYHVVFPSGFFEPVTIRVEGLPPGVSVTPATATDTTSFSMLFTYHILMVSAAAYPVTVTLFSGSFGKKTFKFNVVITKRAPFSYDITGLHDLSVPLYADTILWLPFTTSFTSGINEPVTITPDELPVGVSVLPRTINGLPPFTDSFAFHIIANTTGTFPATLHTTSSQGVRSSIINVNVNAGADCAPVLTGNYFGNTVCASYSGAGTGGASCQVYTAGSGKLLIHIPFGNIPADLNCANATFNSTPVVSPGFTIGGGTGTFDATTITLNYSLSGAINSTCTTTLTR